MRRGNRIVRKGVFAVVVMALLLLPASATATFPGRNGKIAFDRGGDIWTMNPDGSDQVNLTNTPSATEYQPAWSADGTKIAFVGPGAHVSSQIHIVNADGSGGTIAGNDVTPDRAPGWSPDSTQIAFLLQLSYYVMPPDNSSRTLLGSYGGFTNRLDWSPDGQLIAIDQKCGTQPFRDGQSGYIGVIPPVANATVTAVSGPRCTNSSALTNALDQSPSWSPDSQRILFSRAMAPKPNTEVGLYSIKKDGTDLQTVRLDGSAFEPIYSPDAQKIAFVSARRIKVINSDNTGLMDLTDGDSPSWQPIPVNSYPRPRGATPMRLSLVPAAKPCTTPNDSHGAPLSNGSCSPVQSASQYLTTGTPDANGRGAHMTAFLFLQAVVGNPADMKISGLVNDVLNRNDLSDYTGSLHAELPVQITDKDNTPTPSGPGAGTTEPIGYGFDIPCTATVDALVGSNCTVATTANALVPGTIQGGMRSIWEIGQAQVFDGGADSDGSTTGDNTLFLTQGVFVP